MTKQTEEALKMAIEALESFEIVYGDTDLLMPHNFYKTLNACKEALEQPEQEPDYWLGYGLQAHDEKPFEGATPLYTHPAPSWRGLSITERVNVIKSVYEKFEGCGADILEVEIARAIEAKLKEKNHA